MKTTIIMLMMSVIWSHSALGYGEFEENQDATREVFDSVILRVLEKANLSPTAVVGILPSFSTLSKVKPSYFSIMENSLEVILSSRAKLADRSKLMEIDTEKELRSKKGIESIIGSRIGSLKGIDFFIWAKFTPASKGKTNVKIQILDARTSIFRAISSKTIKIAPSLKIDERVDVNQFYIWEEKYRSAKSSRDFGYDAFLTGLVTLGIGILAAPCEEKNTKDDKEYSNFIECNREEGGRIYSSMMAFGIISLVGGGSTWAIGGSNLNDAIDEGKEQKFPTLALFRDKKQEMAVLKLTWRF